jgi:hypothetical protein
LSQAGPWKRKVNLKFLLQVPFLSLRGWAPNFPKLSYPTWPVASSMSPRPPQLTHCSLDQCVSQARFYSAGLWVCWQSPQSCHFGLCQDFQSVHAVSGRAVLTSGLGITLTRLVWSHQLEVPYSRVWPVWPGEPRGHNHSHTYQTLLAFSRLHLFQAHCWAPAGICWCVR